MGITLLLCLSVKLPRFLAWGGGGGGYAFSFPNYLVIPVIKDRFVF